MKKLFMIISYCSSSAETKKGVIHSGQRAPFFVYGYVMSPHVESG